MLKTVSTTILLAVLSPAYTLAYIVAYALRLKDRDLMESPLDFLLMSIDQYLDDTAESRYIKKLTKQIEDFYKKTIFIPAPNIIDLYDTDCLRHIADDLSMFGKDFKPLRDKLIELL